MTSSRDIFTRISDVSEKDRIFRDLCTVHSEIMAKPHEPLSDPFVLRAEVYNGFELSCALIGAISPLRSKGDLILQILLGSEKYLCSAPYEVRSAQVYLKTNVDLFHLQRREDFRLRLPISYKAFFEVQSINGSPIRLRFQILDISGGGCKIHVNPTPPYFKTSDYVKGEIHLPDRPPISISGKVRHEEDDTDTSQTVGIQFVEISLLVRNRLAALVMDLYRELFARLT